MEINNSGKLVNPKKPVRKRVSDREKYQLEAIASATELIYNSDDFIVIGHSYDRATTTSHLRHVSSGILTGMPLVEAYIEYTSGIVAVADKPEEEYE